MINSLSDIIILDDLAAGDYQFIFQNSNGRLDTFYVFIKEADAISGELLVPQYGEYNFYCYNETNGYMQAEIVGGTGDLRYLWNDQEGSDLISDLSAGDYTLTVVDSLGCMFLLEQELVQPDSIEYDIEIINPDCIRPRGSVSIFNLRGGTNGFNSVIDGVNVGSGVRFDFDEIDAEIT